MFDRRRFIGTAGLGLAGLGMSGLIAGCSTSRLAIPPVVATNPVPDDLILDIQRRAFQFFWETTDARTGLAPDRWPTPSFASIAAVGFALTAYPIGVANGWITREAARERTLTTLRFFAGAPQGDTPDNTSGYKGFFYHFLGVTKGQRFARAELSTVDTALLLGGVLFAQSWFDADHPDEAAIRSLADQLYAAVDWQWIVPRAPFMSMGWHPESGFIPSDWNIYNEGMLLYLLAIASPTHPLPAATWDSVTSQFSRAWTDQWGEPHLHFPPMFGHQYSHVWVDFRGIRDRLMTEKGIDYFENSRRATYGQQRYAKLNPGGFAGYAEDCWGLTACDGPGDFKRRIGDREFEFFSYSARGPGDRDDGTLAPTAALGSIAFAPEIVVPCAKAMHARYGRAIYDRYGFIDAFNPTLVEPVTDLKHGTVVPNLGWVDNDYLGIDQGPIVAMIENWRTGLVWKTMQKNAHLRRGLDRAGFKGGWLSA